MPLKKAAGNMYDWVTNMHTHLAGECPHKCKYCYVQTNPHGVSPRYQGEPRLIESELTVNYGSGKIIFIEHMQDLFANSIHWQVKILNHCLEYPLNKYVFQTKNPRGIQIYDNIPKVSLIGTTIETNRDTLSTGISQAPIPYQRYVGMMKLREFFPIFITIEPIMDFDNGILSKWILDLQPEFVNIGADSKKCNLPEPQKWKISNLIETLRVNNIQIKKKTNLGRLLK